MRSGQKGQEKWGSIGKYFQYSALSYHFVWVEFSFLCYPGASSILSPAFEALHMQHCSQKYQSILLAVNDVFLVSISGWKHYILCLCDLAQHKLRKPGEGLQCRLYIPKKISLLEFIAIWEHCFNMWLTLLEKISKTCTFASVCFLYRHFPL